MFRVREMDRSEVFFKGLIALLTAGIVLWLAALAVGDVAIPTPPRTLPSEITTEALPILENPLPVPAELLAADELADHVWNTLELHRKGELRAAIAAWDGVRLPDRVDHWRTLATAVALLELGEWELAQPILERLLQTHAEQPAVHYYAALLRLEQAARAWEWNDAIGPVDVRLAAFHPATPAYPRATYELMAMEELERTLALVRNLRAEEPLTPETYAISTQVPRVADLLMVLGADRLEANAHNVLSDLCIQHGQAERGEVHLDAAVAGGAYVGNAYRELGQLYETEGRHFDAARAYAKAVKIGDGMALPLQKLIGNLWQGVVEGD